MISYKTLEVWIYSMKTAKEIYELTKSYPTEERYGLISQTNRAAVSIAANIAEGVGRNSKNDTLRFFIYQGGLPTNWKHCCALP